MSMTGRLVGAVTARAMATIAIEAIALGAIAIAASGCSNSSTKVPEPSEPDGDSNSGGGDGDGGDGVANVSAVSVSGDPGSLTFAVTIASDETGCDQYADWWEVVSEDGELLYRRILAHSHVSEQPFTRSGGPVDAALDQELIVRAHSNRDGAGSYGGTEFVGSAASGFSAAEAPSSIAASIESAPPQPSGCAF